MANKAYWNMLYDILQTTSTMCNPTMTAGDQEEMQALRKDIRARQAIASDKPMEEITLAGLGKEFIDVLVETCDNYNRANSKSEKDAIINEIKVTSQDIFDTITEEVYESFDYIGTRLNEIER